VEFETIWFHKDQLDEYLNFVNEYHENTGLDKAIPRRKWWIFENIYDGYFLLAYKNKEVASTCFISGKKIDCDDGPLFCFEIGETWTAEKFRRKGLFTKMVKKATEIAFNAGAEVIYGTPNAQSAPGYNKLKYYFIHDVNESLILIPNIMHICLNKAGLKKRQPVKVINIDVGCEPVFRDIKVKEISFEKYLEKTKSFKRMNHISNEYMNWRFKDSFHEYRYFHGIRKKSEFYCTAKPHSLGYLNCILISEYFLNGKLDNSEIKYKFIRIIGSAFYKNYDGLYLKSTDKKSSRKYAFMIKHRAVMHRQLPICYFPRDNQGEKVHKIMADVSNNFQLSDCDIG